MSGPSWASTPIRSPRRPPLARQLMRLLALSAQHLVVEDAAEGSSVTRWSLHDADYDGEEFQILRQQLADRSSTLTRLPWPHRRVAGGIGGWCMPGWREPQAQSRRALCCGCEYGRQIPRRWPFTSGWVSSPSRAGYSGWTAGGAAAASTRPSAQSLSDWPSAVRGGLAVCDKMRWRRLAALALAT